MKLFNKMLFGKDVPICRSDNVKVSEKVKNVIGILLMSEHAIENRD